MFPLCELCKERAKGVTHVVKSCSVLAGNHYKERNDKLGRKVHWLLTKNYETKCDDKWSTHQPEPVQDNKKCKLLWDFPVQKDKGIEHLRSGIIVIETMQKHS